MKSLITCLLIALPLTVSAEASKLTETVEYTAKCSNGKSVKFKAGADLSKKRSLSKACEKAGFGKSISLSPSATASDNDEPKPNVKATDYNSSRSNKNANHSAVIVEKDGQRPNTKATDYNSSRSNKADSIKAEPDEGDQKKAEKAKKQK